MKTKPFNKERAIAGDPVVDGVGRRWEFVDDDGSYFLNLCFRNEEDEYKNLFHDDGRQYTGCDSIYDLSMLDTTP